MKSVILCSIFLLVIYYYIIYKNVILIIDAQPPKYRQEGTASPEKNAGKTGTILSEDYAEIVDEEGDYSTPASKYAYPDYLNDHYFR